MFLFVFFSHMTCTGLSEVHSKAISDLWLSSFVSLSNSAIASTLRVDELIDIEWKFGVTASSSELSKVGNCFIQLNLKLDKGNNVRENVIMELTLQQFYQFLQQMQTASRHADAIAKSAGNWQLFITKLLQTLQCRTSEVAESLQRQKLCTDIIRHHSCWHHSSERCETVDAATGESWIFWLRMWRKVLWIQERECWNYFL